jgi:hypothetical protein
MLLIVSAAIPCYRSCFLSNGTVSQHPKEYVFTYFSTLFRGVQESRISPEKNPWMNVMRIIGARIINIIMLI